MVISSAFEIPEKGVFLQSEYVKIAKTPSFSGKLGEPITFKIVLSAQQYKLIHISVTDSLTFVCRNQAPTVATSDITSQIDKQVPSEIAAGGSATLAYTVPTTTQFNDCLITNNAQVKADVPDISKGGEKSIIVTALTIGNPPVSVPATWPTAHGCITQGPGGITSHNISGHDQAIDINHSLAGTPAIATFNGLVSQVGYNDVYYGNYVILTGQNQGSNFFVLYGHFITVAVKQGQRVKIGDTIGAIGRTGSADAEHLHYEVQGLKMAPPYIPLPVSACDGINNCNICW